MTAARATRWLVVANCLLLSACTETIIKEMPTESSALISDATSDTTQAESVTPDEAGATTEPEVPVMPDVPAIEETTEEPDVPMAPEVSTVPGTPVAPEAIETSISTPSTTSPALPVVNPPVFNPMVSDPVQAGAGALLPDTDNMADSTNSPGNVPQTPATVVDETDELAPDTSVAQNTDVASANPEPAPIITPEPVATPAPVVTPDPVITPAPVVMPEPVATPAPTVTPEPVATPVPDTTVPEAPGAVATIEPQTIVGNPGIAVDCMQQLPCRWVSDDSQFTITATNADNIASRGRLSIQFAASSLHDTQVAIARPDPAIDAGGVQLEPTDQALGAGNGVAPQGVSAGAKMEGTLNFDQATSSTSIANWSIALIDGGLIRNAVFSNIPVGTVTNDYADCQNALPCTWVSPSKDVTITLLSVGGLSTTNRLSANLSIQTATSMTVALDAGASAFGTDGTQFTARTHTLGVVSDYEKIQADTLAGRWLSASIDFFRTTTTPSSLQDLSLVIYNDAPVPRWNPRFTAVPIL